MNFFKACSYYCEDCYSDDVAPQKYAKRSAKIESEIEAYWCVKKFSLTFRMYECLNSK
jgi:hypothetical protein